MIGRIFQRKIRFRCDWPLRSQEEFEGTGNTRGGPSTPRSWLRLLSNMSTGLDVEKLSLEDSDVSFSELATRCLERLFVFRWSLGIVSILVLYYCGVNWLMAHSLRVQNFRILWKKKTFKYKTLLAFYDA